MQQALRPYATAGVAIVGASLIGITPIGAPLRDMGTFRDVALTSGGSDLLTPWIDQFNTASENATTLLNNFSLAPMVAVQQYIANQAGYVQDLLNDPTSNGVTSVSDQMQSNLAAVLAGFTMQGSTSDAITTIIGHTLANDEHVLLFNNLASFIPPSLAPPALVTMLDNFMASPLSGIIMGTVGPEISPWIALINSIAAGDNLNETLANMVGAYFNGADLSLNALVPLIYQTGFLPPGLNIMNLEIGFGGLLTPGTVGVGPYNDAIPAVGGSILNSVGIHLTGVPALGQIETAPLPIGPIGAWESWGQIIGALLGSGWTTSSGTGPVDVIAPLTETTLPIIPTDFLGVGAGTSAAVADLSGLVQDVVSGLGL